MALAVPNKKHLWIMAGAFALYIILQGATGYVWASQVVTVRFLRNVEVDNETIQLGNIAEIAGQNQELVGKLRTTTIGTSPLPGRSCEINEEYVKIRLKQNDIDVSEILFVEAGETNVSRSFIEIRQEDLEKIVLDYIYGHAPWDRKKMRITNIRITENVTLPKGEVTYSVTPLKHNDFLGTVMVPILFKVDGTVNKKVWATADVAVLHEVVMTKKPLGRYQLITEGDVHVKTLDVTNMSSTALTSLEEVLGKRARRAINANVALNTNLIELPPLVQRGDIVKIIARSEALTVTTIGKIKEKGHRGEQVRVENLGSKREIYARVLDSHTVTVDF